ncbi:hypothetical protein [Curtobacterium ammoniigenes]|uniref:hypothetical protein n=1 Tax=Curtobacterium ammoniigenes TaxID=395387 RepID=UPI000836132C|nr:hypothetical protein [Curtobacterium ammoniigenes]
MSDNTDPNEPTGWSEPTGPREPNGQSGRRENSPEPAPAPPEADTAGVAVQVLREDSPPGIYEAVSGSGSVYRFRITPDLVTMTRNPPPFTPAASKWAASLYGDGDELLCLIVRLQVGRDGEIAYIKPDRLLSDPAYTHTGRFPTRIQSIHRLHPLTDTDGDGDGDSDSDSDSRDAAPNAG